MDEGHVIERFIGIIHVNHTSALSFKEAIDGFFSQHGLSIANLGGQGYDGASNMQGEFHGLKTLILTLLQNWIYLTLFTCQVFVKYIKFLESFYASSNPVSRIRGFCF